MDISGTTKICAVIGNPVQHSLSPCMHNAAFTELGLNFAYVAFHVLDVDEALLGMRGLQIKGLSVTIPHKLSVIPCCDKISPIATNIGAVNTITLEDNLLIGTNTDGYGALNAIEDVESAEQKHVVLLGVGGAARAIAFTLIHERALSSLTLVGRNKEKTQALANELSTISSTNIQISSFQHEELQPVMENAQIIINTTPIGMHPNTEDTPIPSSLLCSQHFVFDTIYNPARTRLLLEAEQQGAKIKNGVDMFVLQGAEQFKLWTKQDPPIQIMRNAVEKALELS